MQMALYVVPWVSSSTMFPLGLVHRAAQRRHDDVLLIPDDHSIKAKLLCRAVFIGDRGQYVAHRDRLRIRDGVLDCNGDAPVRVARKGERAIGKRIDDPTMRNPKSVDH